MLLLLALLLGSSLCQDYPLPPRATEDQCAFGLEEGSSPLDCFPEAGASQDECLNRGCCWRDVPLTAGSPNCYFPRGFFAFAPTNESGTLQRLYRSQFPGDVREVRMEYAEGEFHLALKLSDAQNERWRPPHPELTDVPWGRSSQSCNGVNVKILDEGYLMAIRRGLSELTLEMESLIFAEQFVQLTISLENVTLYGVGEHRTRLVLDENWTKYTLWNHDGTPVENANLYGSHPFVLAVLPGGASTGIYFHNSNAVEIVLQPGPKVTFRSIGGILEFHVVFGDSPAEAVSKYIKLVGLPAMPPYWGLGFQLCRWGYWSTNNTRAVWQRMREKNIPYDVQWNDIDYMRTRNDFTLDMDNFGDLPQFVDDLHAAGMHYVPMIDPGVSGSEVVEYHPFTDGIEMDVFVKDYKGDLFLGAVWNPNVTVFPDFTHPRALEYWTKQLREFRDVVKYDAIWLDMNEPSSGVKIGCPESALETPPYLPPVQGGKLQSGTMCMTNKHHIGNHYDVHNLFAISEANITRTAVEDIIGKRTFVISRSSFAGQGRYSGHWSGDNFSSWSEMVASVTELLTYSLFGVPFMGSDICGFALSTERQLCNRWTQLGTFYPFSRNHNTLFSMDQDPASFDDEAMSSMKKAISTRYLLLPYLYTLFYEAQVFGSTVARPLFFEFPNDTEAMKVDRAFLWGSGLYIVPVLEENATSVTAYLPNARWFKLQLELDVFEEVLETGVVIFDAPFDTIPLLLRGGSIIPTQSPMITTTESRKQPVTFIVVPDEKNEATGQLFWDDGESLDPVKNGKFGLVEVKLAGKKVQSTVRQWSTEPLSYGDVVILDVALASEVTLNGRPVSFDLKNNLLIVHIKNLTLAEPLDITWM